MTCPFSVDPLLNYSDHSVGLRRVYDRPIAIGFRGVTIEYDFCITRGIKSGSCKGGISGSVATNTAVSLGESTPTE